MQLKKHVFLEYFLECFCFPRCLTRRYGRMYQVLRPPSLILSSLRSLSRWNYTSNEKKEENSSKWSSDAKLGFVDLILNLIFQRCYQLSTLPSTIVTKLMSCVVWHGCVSLAAVRPNSPEISGKQQPLFSALNSYAGYLRAVYKGAVIFQASLHFRAVFIWSISQFTFCNDERIL